MEKKSIGKFIMTLRKSKGMTQEQLGSILHVSNKTISSWESDRSSPDLSILPVIAEIFDVSVEELIIGEKRIDEEDISKKEKKVYSQLAKRNYLRFKNNLLLTSLFLIISTILAVLSTFFLPALWAIIVLTIALIAYIAGLIILIVLRSNYLLTIDGYNPYIRKSLLIYTRFISLYTFYLLSPLFYFLMNKTLLNNQDYSLNDEEKNIINNNAKKKKKYLLYFGLPGLIVLIVGLFFTNAGPWVFAKKYNSDEIKEYIYTLNINKNNDALTIMMKAYNYSHTISTKEGTMYQNIPTGDITLDLYFGPSGEYLPKITNPSGGEYLPKITKELSNGFSVEYQARSCIIYYENNFLLGLSSNVTENDTLHFAPSNNSQVHERFKNQYTINESGNWQIINLFTLLIDFLIVGSGFTTYLQKREKLKFNK